MKIREADYPPETIEALQETFDIEAGKIPAKRYHSSQELFDANYGRIRQDCGESLGHREEEKMHVLDKKRISITSKRQLTIPQKFYSELGFGSEAMCTLLDGALVIEPVESVPNGEFDDLILADLIKEGYEGDALLAEFKARRARVRPAMEMMEDIVETGSREIFYDDLKRYLQSFSPTDSFPVND